MYDYTIIGMGISGCYIAYKLNRLYPNKKILCIESSNRYGGRILSAIWNNSIVDLGAWRYSSSEHRVVQYLVDIFNIDTVPIDQSNSIDIPTDDINGVNLVQHLTNLGWSNDRIRSYIDSTGYNIFNDDIALRYTIPINGPFYYMKNGYIQLCDKMISLLNSNVHILYNTKVNTLEGYNNLYVTVQPNVLVSLYPIPILGSMIGYDSIRMYLYIDIDIPIGTYRSTYPIRKLYSIGNRYMIIYVDGNDARIVESTIGSNPSMIEYWLYMITGYHMNIISYIYKYWIDGIYFWRPRANKNIDVPFHYINGDVSSQPGWVNGSLLMVDSII